MKTIITLLLTLLLAFAMGCNKNQAAEEAQKQPQTQQGGASTGAQQPAGAADASKGQVDIDDIELGKAIGADKKVTDATDNFAPSDTVYASIRTDGAAANSTVRARWTYGDSGQLVKEDSHQVPAGGAAFTEFHISKPGGFPKGQYHVTFWVNNDEKGKKSFEVK